MAESRLYFDVGHFQFMYTFTIHVFINFSTRITEIYIFLDGGLLSMLELMDTHRCLSSFSVAPTTELRQFFPLFIMVEVPMTCHQG